MNEFILYRGDVNKVNKWLKTNDINLYNNYALCWSAAEGHLEVVRVLIKAGANIHARNNESLSESSRCGHLEVVRELIKAGANVHAEEDRAFFWSVFNGHLEVMRELIKAGADIHVNNDVALRCGTLLNHLEVVRELIKHYKYIKFTHKLCDKRSLHYINLVSIMFDLPYELYDEIARFI